jgi:DNA helicase II / ATP-dependent DNA helicase PcrA
VTRSYALQGRRAARVPPIDFASALNRQQLDAVTFGEGAALVIAGAGSGKTRTLTYRVAHLLSQGVKAREILLLTFTNKAAREMLGRVAGLVPGGADGIWGGTFHAVGNRILRRHAEAVGFRPGFSIMDREDSSSMIDNLVSTGDFATGDRKFPKGGVLAEIFSLSVNTGRPIEQTLAGQFSYFLPLANQIEAVHHAYTLRKRQANAMDFDDLLSKTLELLATNPETAGHHQFRHVLVDEYQDTNLIQADLVDRFAQRHGNITVVGDDAQSIYSWRGANFENILRFRERHPSARIFHIETNYRSVPGVLEVANAAIRANERQFPKTLAAIRPAHTAKPALVELDDNNEQAAFVAQRILDHHGEGVPLGEMAVLYRAHFHSLEIQLEFTRRGIPFSITSGLRFFEQAHIKDVAAFLKLAVNANDEVSFRRIVRLLPGIGERGAESLWERASARLRGGPRFGALMDLKVPPKARKPWTQLIHTLEELCPADKPPLPPSEMLRTVVFAVYDDIMQQKFTNYQQRAEDLSTFASFAAQFDNTTDFLSQVALLASAEIEETTAGPPDADRVCLSTIHQAKGLEWKVVFLIWLCEGMFPNKRAADSPAALEEERRLFYVGITRCKDDLYLAFPGERLNASYGDPFPSRSRFLDEIPEDLLETWTVEDFGDDAPF